VTARADGAVALDATEVALLVESPHFGPVLAGLEPRLRARLLELLERVQVDAGDVVLAQGAPSDALHIVVSGALRVVDGADGSSGPWVGAGRTVGELGLLTGEPRSATVVARRDSILARLSREGWRDLLAADPEAVVAAFSRPIVGRLLDPGAAEPQRRAVVAVVPSRAGLGAATVVDGLVAALGADERVATAGRREAEAMLGVPGALEEEPGPEEDRRLVAWTNGLEAGHDHVVLLADPRPNAWTRRCARQADVVVVLADAGDDPGPTPVERALDDLGVDGARHLLLLHPPTAAAARGTAAWLLPRRVDAHHLVRRGHEGDVARAARLAAGAGTALVLSGGGARALAQLGVARALAAHGTAIDLLVGSSAGAIVAALLGEDPDLVGVEERVAAVVRRPDWTLPLHAATRGGTWTAALRELFGEGQLEDLWRPTAVVSTNLTRSSRDVHRQGGVAQAVRASTAIPGLLPPVLRGGDVHVDGGLLDNLPVDVAADDPGVARVVAVDVGAGPPLRAMEPFGDAIGGWWSVLDLLRPGRRSALPPTLPEVTLQTVLLANEASSRATRHLAHRVIRPSVDDVPLLAYDRVAELVARGEAHAQAELARGPLGWPWDLGARRAAPGTLRRWHPRRRRQWSSDRSPTCGGTTRRSPPTSTTRCSTSGTASSSPTRICSTSTGTPSGGCRSRPWGRSRTSRTGSGATA
jgi:NTE family protein